MRLIPVKSNQNFNFTQSSGFRDLVTKERIVSCAACILSAALAYKASEKAFLLSTGAIYAGRYALIDKNNTLEQGSPESDRFLQLIYLTSCIVLSAWAGKGIGSSWVQPKAPWERYILRIPLYLCAFELSIYGVISGPPDITAKVISKATHTDSTIQVKILLAASFVLPAAFTFAAPHMNLHMGLLSILTSLNVVGSSLEEGKDLSGFKKIKYVINTLKMAAFISLGSNVGKLTRHYFGPTDLRIANGWKSAIFLTPTSFIFHSIALTILGLAYGAEYLQTLLENRLLGGRDIKEVGKEIVPAMEEAVQEMEAWKDYSTLEQFEKEADKTFSYFSIFNPEFWDKESLKANVKHWIKQDVAHGMCKSDPQLIKLTLENTISTWKQNTLSLKEALEIDIPQGYEVDFSKDKPSELEALKEQIHSRAEPYPGFKREDWSKRRAAYILSAPADNKEAQKKNYRKLAVWFHPDKSPGKDYEETFKIIGTAYEKLTKED